MNHHETYVTLLGNREELYLLLGRLYKLEVDKPLLDKLKQMTLPSETGYKELDEGYQSLGLYLQQSNDESITDLAVDYARVFLGAGIFEGVVAHPYESVYTSEEKLIMQEAWEQVAETYQTHGLSKSSSLDIAEDHIALEFEFMAYLCHKIQQAIAKDDWQTINHAIETQKVFLQQHLLNWVPNFCEDILHCSSSEFYKAIAKITERFLTLDLDLLEELSASSAAFGKQNSQDEQLATRM